MIRRAALAAVLPLALAGCAALAPVPRAAGPPPSAAASAPTPAPPAAAAARDSAPSQEALAVLATIPEPVAGATASPARPPSSPPAPATAAAPARPDSTPGAFADRDSGSADSSAVPVPAPTAPLGDRPGAPPPREAPPLPPPPDVAPPPALPPAAAKGDSCWRVQVAAPTERPKGAAMRDAAQSLLIVPMALEREGGRWKVRSRECLGREAAESLRARAIASGFRGVFLVRIARPR